jgi:ribosomal protein S18 acetylase RimI-like enzyme
MDVAHIRDPHLVARLEAHAVHAWPATFTEQTYDGWILRATPGLDRGRSNHALPPPREIGTRELGSALERIGRFSQRHGTNVGIQVSPLHLLSRLQSELDALEWGALWPTLVMTAPGGRYVRPATRGAPIPLTTSTHASRDWLTAWQRCDGREDIEGHETSVFRILRGHATFAQIEDEAVAVAVPGDGLVGLFSIAVAPERRRGGLGRIITSELIAQWPDAIPYVQVEQSNVAAIAMYEQLGFTEAYRYCHRLPPPDG